MQGTKCEQGIPVVVGQYFVLVGVRRTASSILGEPCVQKLGRVKI